MPGRSRTIWTITGLLCAFWVACAALALAGLWTTLLIGTVRMQGDTSLAGLLRLQGVPWLATALLTPAVVAWSVALAHRGRWQMALAIHAAGLIAFAAADTVLTIVLHMSFQSRGYARITFEALAGRAASGAVLLTTKYACIVVVTAAYLYLERASAARAQADALARTRAELERDLASARLMALRQQLHPHFLFNALNAVAGLIDQDSRQAQRVLVQLSDLLRLALTKAVDAESTLGDELDFADRYLEIERARLGDRLQVTYDVEPDALGARLPSFSLQPLVENGVRHGIAKRVERGSLTIAARRDVDKLMVKVVNDVSDSSSSTDGSGLTNLRARLEGLYGAAASLTTRRADGRFVAELVVPQERAG